MAWAKCGAEVPLLASSVRTYARTTLREIYYNYILSNSMEDAVPNNNRRLSASSVRGKQIRSTLEQLEHV